MLPTHINWLVVFSVCMPLAWASHLSVHRDRVRPCRTKWWARLDSNQRRINRRIYSAMPLPLGDWPIWWTISESNWWPHPCKGCVLPTELMAHIKGSYSTKLPTSTLRSGREFTLCRYPRWLSSLLERSFWRLRPDLNGRPLAWQASVLTNWTTEPYKWFFSSSDNH